VLFLGLNCRLMILVDFFLLSVVIVALGISFCFILYGVILILALLNISNDWNSNRNYISFLIFMHFIFKEKLFAHNIYHTSYFISIQLDLIFTFIYYRRAHPITFQNIYSHSLYFQYFSHSFPIPFSLMKTNQVLNSAY
jgi:hypothetical protein